MQILRYDEVSSTMDCDIPEYPELIVVAKSQTKGRGQRGSSWITPTNSLVFTYFANLEISNTANVSIRVGCELARTLLSLYPQAPITIKWPNDLLVDSKKFCGILVETKKNSASTVRVAVGIGVNFSAPSLAPSSGSVSPGAIDNVPESEIFEAARRGVFANLDYLFVNQHLAWKNAPVIVNCDYQANLLCISPEGHLIVQTQSATQTLVTANVRPLSN